MAAGGHRHLPVVDLERGVVEGAPRAAPAERVGMASRVVAGGRRAVAALIAHGCTGQIAMRDILAFYLDFESTSTPRPLGEDTEDFYELFDRDDEREE